MRSLLDRADLATIRRAAARYPGLFATIAACLIDGGLAQFDPDDPDWDDRDRVLVGDEEAAKALTAALAAAGANAHRAVVRAAPGVAVCLATGAAMASGVDGGLFRVWCLISETAVTDGLVWEGARAAAAAGVHGLAVLAVARRTDTSALSSLFAAAGWQVRQAAADDVIELLGAMDHALASTTGPVLVLGTPT